MVQQQDSIDWDSIDQDLTLWRQRWDFDGYALKCKGCGSRQLPALSKKPFPHNRSCISHPSRFDFPWREIFEVMVRSKVSNLGKV